MSIQNANLRFNENGTPIAQDFDDVYFSDAEGINETQYVFLTNNDLPNRWHSHTDNIFTIAETGFGTGLNFIVTLLNFLEFIQKAPNSNLKLHFVSIEKFPVSRQDLIKAYECHPNLQPFVEELIEQYPQNIAGCHRLHFLANRVQLDLWLGDVHDILPNLPNQQEGLVDAWYLDGFAPSKNPDMWSQTLFDFMAGLAKDECTFSTFTAAGFVRRGLIQAGFDVEKRKGFGHKREMIAGQISKPAQQQTIAPYFIRNQAVYTSKSIPKIAIIGAGLAGANISYALAKKGFKSTLYCQDSDVAMGASGNPQGGFYPQLNAEAGISSLIHAHAFLYAKQLYQKLLKDGFEYQHDWCGTLQIAFNDKVATRYQKLIHQQTWPETLVHWVDDKKASEIANLSLPYPSLFIPEAGWINPPELVKALIKAAKSTVETEHQLISLECLDNQWHLTWKEQPSTQADMVIFANGDHSHNLAQLNDIPFRLVRGQVEAVPSTGELSNLSTVLCHKGYLTPAWQGRHALGSTYVKQDQQTDYRITEQTTNLNTHQKALEQCQWIHKIQADATGRAAIRCSTPDHLPVVGAVPNFNQQKSQYRELYKALPDHKYPKARDLPNLFVLSGLGSRGLTTAPLCAELLASQIAAEPLPLSTPLLNALNPNRFLIRDLIRRKI